MVNGITSLPFSATTLPFPVDQISNPEEITENSRIRYCGKRNVVEREILLKYYQDTNLNKKQETLF